MTSSDLARAPGIVTLSDDSPPPQDAELAALAARAIEARGKVDLALDLAERLGSQVPVPGAGQTGARWEALATIAAVDLTVARAVEPHLDAVAILREAGGPVPAGRWGVFASEGPASTLTAAGPDGLQLTGTKPWCSLAGALSHALVTAAVGTVATERRLFAVDLRHPGVSVAQVEWIARGLSAVPSGPIELLDVPGQPVGAPGWYLDRPGFWWGGVGVAACWYGGAVGLARTAWTHVHQRHAPGKPGDPLAAAQLGRIDLALHVARVALADAAAKIDNPATPAERLPLLAQRVRAVVAGACEDVLRESAHLLGPAPLAFDEDHARRVADLGLYVRQHHADRDLAALGSTVAGADQSPY